MTIYKKYPIIARVITLILIGVCASITYFSYQKYQNDFFDRKTKECSDETEKRKASFKDENITIYENFYSQKIWKCLIKWSDLQKSSSVIVSATWILKELYTWRIIYETEKICNDYKSCNILIDYNAGRIQELNNLSQDTIEKTCKAGVIWTGSLEQYCTIARRNTIWEEFKIKTKEYE